MVIMVIMVNFRTLTVVEVVIKYIALKNEHAPVLPCLSGSVAVSVRLCCRASCGLDAVYGGPDVIFWRGCAGE